MKAVIKLGGQQFTVTENESLLVDLLPEGTKELTLEPLMVFDGKDVKIGTPLVSGVKIKVTVIEPEVKGDKLRVIRYKAKKRVNTQIGHRQKYSRVQVGTFGK